MNGDKMSPAIKHNDKFLTRRYLSVPPKVDRVDLIMFKYEGESVDRVSRVIGLPGEKIRFQDKKIYFDRGYDKVQLNEGYLPRGKDSYLKVSKENEWIQLGPYDYLVLNDNRGEYIDVDKSIISQHQIKSGIIHIF